jgi:hypothetical protein
MVKRLLAFFRIASSRQLGPLPRQQTPGTSSVGLDIAGRHQLAFLHQWEADKKSWPPFCLTSTYVPVIFSVTIPTTRYFHPTVIFSAFLNEDTVIFLASQIFTWSLIRTSKYLYFVFIICFWRISGSFRVIFSSVAPHRGQPAAKWHPRWQPTRRLAVSCRLGRRRILVCVRIPTSRCGRLFKIAKISTKWRKTRN